MRNLFKRTKDNANAIKSTSLPLYYSHGGHDRKLLEFTRMERNPRRGFSWVGTHPKTPYAVHFLHIETNFSKQFSDVTHQYFLGVSRGGVTVPLYGRQAKMDAPGLMPDNVAIAVGNQMVRSLLLRRDPKSVPGFLLQIREGQECPWSKIFQDARNKVIAAQLKKYHVSIKAYLLEPETYNAIKDPPPFVDED